MTAEGSDNPGDLPKTHRLEALSAKVDVSASVDAKVKRGKDSWAYIYTMLGFALTIETGIMGLITPIRWPCNLILLLIVGAATVYLFLDNGWFQNKLIGFKSKFEEKGR